MNAVPITDLSEEERIFRDTVREVAATRVRPRVAEMGRDKAQAPVGLEELFGLGLMGLEIPEVYGRAGASFFMAILAIEEIARVDPALATPVDVQNTLVVKMILRCGCEEQNRQL